MVESVRLVDLSSRHILAKGLAEVVKAEDEPLELLKTSVYPEITEGDRSFLVSKLNERLLKAEEDPAIGLQQIDTFRRFVGGESGIIERLGLKLPYDDEGLRGLSGDDIDLFCDLVLGLDKYSSIDGILKPRQKGIDPMEYVLSLPEEQRSAYLSTLAGAGADMARYKLRSPKTGKAEIVDAIEEWRERAYAQKTVWIPPDSTMMEFIKDKVEPNTRVEDRPVVDSKFGLVSRKLLVRPPQIKEVSAGVYEELPESKRELTRLIEGARRDIERRMTYDFVQRVGFAVGGDLSYAQLNSTAIAEENLDGATFAFIAHQAKQALEAYDRAVYGSTEKIAERLGEVTPSSVEFAAILQGIRFGQAIELRDGRLVSTEISVSRALDVLLGNEGQPLVASNKELYFDERNPSRHFYEKGGGRVLVNSDNVTAGQPLYYFENNPSVVFTLDKKSQVGNEAGKVKMVFEPSTHPLREKMVPAQELFTLNPMMRSEVGSAFWYEAIKRDLEILGINVSQIKAFPDLLAFDNSEELTASSKRVRQAAAKALLNDNSVDIDAEVGKYMLQTAAFTSFGDVPKNAVRLLQPLGYSRMLDVVLNADVRSELDIKMDLWTYWEKYRINPALIRKVGQAFMNPLVSWKRKQLDYRLSIAGKPDTGMIAEWRDQLNPDAGGKISGAKFVDEVLEGTNKGNELRSKLELLIEELCYHRLDWRSSVPARSRMASEIVALAKEGNREAVLAAAEKSRVAYFDYQTNWNKDNTVDDNDVTKQTRTGYTSMAPEMLPRSRAEILLLANELDSVDRKLLSYFDFKDALKSIGFQYLEWNNDEYRGWNGLMHLLSTSSTEHLLIGDVDKIFKYTSKYPDVAVAFGSALNKLIPSLNNAISPLVEAYLGGLPDRFEAFNPDQLSEAIGKTLVNLAFIGKRNQGDAGKYVHEVIDGLLALPSMAPFIDQETSPANLLDLITIIDAFSGEAVQGSIYELDKKVNRQGGSGDAFKKLTIDKRDNNYDLMREGLRLAMFTDEQPAGTSKVPVVWGTQPLFAVSGKMIGSGSDAKWEADKPMSWEVLGLYGHKGKEILMTYILLEYAMDKMLLTKEDVKAGMRRVGMKVDLFDTVARHYEKFKQEAMSRVDQENGHAEESTSGQS